MRKVAIVNDDADFLTAMEMLLEEEKKYNAMIIHEGNTAYRIIKKEQPELIILDIRMEQPETGWHVLDLLTLDPETSHIPVIICTASIKIPEEKEIWLNEHGIQILPKPFDINDLLGMIEKIFLPKKKKVFLEKND